MRGVPSVKGWGLLQENAEPHLLGDFANPPVQEIGEPTGGRPLPPDSPLDQGWEANGDTYLIVILSGRHRECNLPGYGKRDELHRGNQASSVLAMPARPDLSRGDTKRTTHSVSFTDKGTSTEARPQLSFDNSELHEVRVDFGSPRGTKLRQSARLPRALLPSNRDLLQTLTSQRGTTSQGRLDRPPKQPEQSPHRGRQLPGTRLPVLQRCGENVEAAEIKTLSEDSRGKHKKCVSANLVRVGQGGIFPLLLRLFWARKCTLHSFVYYSSYIGGCLDVTPLSFRSFRSVPSGIVERRPLLLRSLRLIWGPRQTTPPASHRGS